MLELLERISEWREMIHDILNCGHRLLEELAHTVMVLGEWGHNVSGGEGTLTHVKPCVGPLQPEVGQVHAGAHRPSEIIITLSHGVVGGGVINLGVDVEPPEVTADVAGAGVDWWGCSDVVRVLLQLAIEKAQ